MINWDQHNYPKELEDVPFRYVGMYGTALVVDAVPSNYKFFATDKQTGHHIYVEPRKGFSLAVRV